MKTEINPIDTERAEAFEMWMTSPMPMVTLTKTFDVSKLLKASRKTGVKFNALLCWCIGKAAAQGPIMKYEDKKTSEPDGTDVILLYDYSAVRSIISRHIRPLWYGHFQNPALSSTVLMLPSARTLQTHSPFSLSMISFLIYSQQ